MSDFTAYTPATASPAGKEILLGIEKNFGFIPNLFNYMIAAPTTVQAYLQMMQLISQGSFSPAQAQLALLAVSLENDCHFCTVAHRALGKKAGIQPQTLTAILAGQKISDEKDRALVQFTQLLVRERGRPGDAELQNFFAAGFSQAQVFELMLIIAVKTLSNYSNHLTQPEPNPQLVAML